MKTIQDVDAERQDVEWKVDVYLRARGWQSTCNNPASLCLWEKALPDGRVMLMSKETALTFERMTYEGDAESTDA